ncbi:MAG: TonB-dependent receptor [Bacteroidota bacterium]
MIQRIWLILWMNGVLMSWGQGNQMDPKLSIHFQNIPLKTCLVELNAQTQIPIAFQSDHPAMRRRVSAKFEDEHLQQILSSILQNSPLTFQQLGNTFTIYPKKIPSPSQRKPSSDEDAYIFRGYIQEKGSQEKIIGAVVYVPSLQIGTYTNNFGFFSLSLPQGSHQVLVRSVNHEQHMLTLQLRRDTFVQVDLAIRSIQAVEIEGFKSERDFQEAGIGTAQLPLETIKQLPALLGEVDVIKAFQLLPGVQAGPDGTSNLLVRGGGPGQNLILVDDVPLYYLNHAGGLVSVFQPYTLKQVKLTKGGFPARYGGRLSSVMDIRLKEGDMNEFHGSVGAGILSSHIALEGPIQKGKTSFLLSGRRSFADLLLRPYSRLNSEGEAAAGYTFYDMTAKLNHIFSQKDRLFLSMYLGNDRIPLQSDETYEDIFTQGIIQAENELTSAWGNQIAALRWNHLWGSRAFSNVTATFSRYRFKAANNYRERIFPPAGSSQDPSDNRSSFDYRSQVQDWGLKWDVEYYPQPRHTLRAGAQATYHQFQPGTLGLSSSFESQSIDTSFVSAAINRWEGAFYLEDEWRLSEKLRINGGLHLNAYETENGFRWNLQPRLTGSLQILPQAAWKFGYTRMRQNLHLLANTTLGLPIDFWVPATARVPSQDLWQVSTGIHAGIDEGKWQMELEGYYREMNGLIEYKEGSNFFENFFGSDWQDNVETNGTGSIYGLELLLKKNYGKTQGWISYTLSKNTRQFPNINAGQPFPFRYDQRHYANLVVQHQVRPNVSLNLSWVIHTGRAYTLSYAQALNPVDLQGLPNPIGSFQSPTSYEPDFNSPLVSEVFNPTGQIFPDGRNGTRYPLYHRLDLGASFTKEKTHGTRIWRVGLYNAYNRLNPLSIYLSSTSVGQPELRQLILFPILPSISYNFEF